MSDHNNETARTIPEQRALSPSQRFDPRHHIIRLPNGEYLEVKWRLVWFRQEHPAGRIDTEVLEVTPDYARVRATASYPIEVGGQIEWALGTGHGTATRTAKQYGDRYVERAETAAIGRALAALGYGTQYASELSEDDDELSDAPVARPQPPEDDNPWDVPPHPRSVEAQRRQRGRGVRRATAKQIGFIKRLMEEQEITDETLEQTLHARYGHGLDELTTAEASEVIEALQADQFAAPAERAAADQADEDEAERKRRGESIAQSVEALAREYGWTMSRVTHWFRREFGMRRWSDLTDEAIDALHAEMERERAEVHGIPDGDEEGADA